MRVVVPMLTRLTTGRADSQLLWQYYWDTIDSCVPAETVIASLATAGFRDIEHRLELGMFSSYTALRPAI